jgi:hypothetical protein
VKVEALRDLVHASPSRAQHDRSIEIRSTVALNQRKIIRPVSKILHERECAEEADENEEDDKGEKQDREQAGSRACEDGGAGMRRSLRSVCQGR